MSRFPTLGDDGLTAVLDALSSPSGGSRRLINKWETMSFRSCELGDKGIAALLAYAEQSKLPSLSMEGNKFEASFSLCSICLYTTADTLQLRADPHLFPHIISSCNLTSLSLAGNRGLLSKSVVTLFDSLSSSTLVTLNLSDCDLGPDVVEAIGKYLCSTRSRTLRRLVLSRNRFGLEDIRGIVDAVERGCFTLLSGLGALQEDCLFLYPTAFTGKDAGEDEKVKQELERLHTLYRRNKDLADRVKQAAAQCLPYARILLSATPDSSVHPIPTTPFDINPHSFRLLDLPSELVVHITRHTSGDPTALSDAQFLRLQQEAEGKDGLARAIKQGATVLKETMTFHELNRGLRRRPMLMEEDWRLPMGAEDTARIRDRLKEDWLKAVDCEKWECNV